MKLSPGWCPQSRLALGIAAAPRRLNLAFCLCVVPAGWGALCQGSGVTPGPEWPQSCSAPHHLCTHLGYGHRDTLQPRKQSRPHGHPEEGFFLVHIRGFLYVLAGVSVHFGVFLYREGGGGAMAHLFVN